MPMPATDPEWASDETNNTEPDQSQKETGWTEEQEADSDAMNWWMFLVYTWILWFKELWHSERVINVAPVVGNGTGWAYNSDGYLESTAAGTWAVGIDGLRVGERVKSITFEVWGDASADLSGEISWRPKAAAKTLDQSISVSNPAAAWVDQVYDVTDREIEDGDEYFVLLTSSAAGLRVGTLRVTVDMP